MKTRLLQLGSTKQTYSNLLYLVLSFPLGIIYFVLLITGLSVGIGTVIIWIGIFILFLVMLLGWKLAELERARSMYLLQIHIPPMTVNVTEPRTRWKRISDHISNSVTWKSLLYLFLLFPFGTITFILTIYVLSFVLAICIISSVLGLVAIILALPFIALTNLVTTQKNQVQATTSSMGTRLLFCCTAFGLAFAPLYITNALAWQWGRFARSMLGISDNAIRLEEAEKVAQQERARAAKAEQARRELIINVSHELRTPVASIRGHLESLLLNYDSADNMPAPEEMQKYLGIVHREAKRLGTLVEELLSLARSDTNELRLNISAVDATEVVEEVYQTLMPLARRERQITLIRTLPQHLPAVKADRQRLLQVLLNLVRNAITYTPDGGIVSISIATPDAQHLVLSVADTGIGILPEDQERIFERFYRTDASRTRTSGGFGLGLSIVRDLVQAMGGMISVESKINEGSSFHVQLQIATTSLSR